MKHILFASAVALALALPQSAKADGIFFGYGFGFGSRLACPSDPCIPWYTYFPCDAHHYQPGPVVVYPHWPQRPAMGARVDMPALNAQMYNPYCNSGVRQANYYAGVPSYWYGR